MTEATTKVLVFTAVAEVAAGLALLVVPSLFGQLLLGEQLTGVAMPVARVAGIALISDCRRADLSKKFDPAGIGDVNAWCDAHHPSPGRCGG